MSIDKAITNQQPLENQPKTDDLILNKKQEKKIFYKQITEYAQNYFNNLLLGNTDSAKNGSNKIYRSMEEIQCDLNVFSGSEEEWGKTRYYSENFREATNIFLNELLKFSKENEGDEKIDNFLQLIKESLFSSSPQISSALDFERHFNFSAKATRSKHLQTHLGRDIIADLASKIGWQYNPDSKNDELFENFCHSSVSEKLDKMQLLEMLGIDLAGAGASFQFGDKKIIKLLEKIKLDNKNVFV